MTAGSFCLSNLNDHVERCFPFYWQNTWLPSNAITMGSLVGWWRAHALEQLHDTRFWLIVFGLNPCGRCQVLPEKVHSSSVSGDMSKHKTCDLEGRQCISVLSVEFLRSGNICCTSTCKIPMSEVGKKYILAEKYINHYRLNAHLMCGVQWWWHRGFGALCNEHGYCSCVNKVLRFC